MKLTKTFRYPKTLNAIVGIALLGVLALASQPIRAADYSYIVTVPDELVAEMKDVFGEDYSATIPNPAYDPEDPESEEAIPNPQSKTSYAKQALHSFTAQAITKAVNRYRVKTVVKATPRTFPIVVEDQ